MLKRYYVCDLCDHKFSIMCSKGDPDPECPKCNLVADIDETTERELGEARIRKMVDEGRAPGVLGVKSKAIDYVQSMAENDYGLTDMRDNTRPGEANFKPESPLSNVDATERAREVMQVIAQQPALTPVSPHIHAISGAADPRETYWGGSGSLQGAAGPPGGAPANIAASAPAASVTRAEGNDPVAKLHAAGQQGLLGNNYEVCGKAPIPKDVGL